MKPVATTILGYQYVLPRYTSWVMSRGSCPYPPGKCVDRLCEVLGQRHGDIVLGRRYGERYVYR